MSGRITHDAQCAKVAVDLYDYDRFADCMEINDSAVSLGKPHTETKQVRGKVRRAFFCDAS